ncbi:hypothetical protein F5884DRAFT_751659 [Xylogone sp. PMI_703]|nr:hypothetical protein F5884DRAFT_751659 [Xylogone sp. PMI_703]
MTGFHKSAFFVLSATVAAAFSAAPPICVVSPLGTVNASETITAAVNVPQGTPCVATLVFSNENFLPVEYVIHAADCIGYQQAQIAIPPEAPNGPASVIWECAGGNTRSCVRLSIQGGTENFQALDPQQTGIAECVVPVATITTLATVTLSSTTEISVLVTTELDTITATEKATSIKTTAAPCSTTSGSNTFTPIMSSSSRPSISTRNTGPTTSISRSLTPVMLDHASLSTPVMWNTSRSEVAEELEITPTTERIVVATITQCMPCSTGA